MALTNEQLKLLESCPALVAFKDWFVEVDALLSNDAETTEPTEPVDDTEPVTDGEWVNGKTFFGGN